MHLIIKQLDAHPILITAKACFLPINRCKQTTNAASSLFQQSTTETPWTQETGGTIKVVRNKVQQLEIDIKIETFYIPQVFAQCTGASAAVPPVHSRHCHHTADPPAPDGDLIIKENRLDR